MSEEVIPHTPAVIPLIIGFAALLIGFLSLYRPVQSIIAHFWGRHGTGKTTAEFIALSIFGMPGERSGLLLPWNSTANSYKIDTVPPNLNIVSPAENAILPSKTVSISGSTNDATSSPVSVVVTVNGGAAQSVSVAGDGTFSYVATCTEGANTITIVATDGAGKTSTVTRHLTIDTSVPAITAVSIAPNPVDTGATMLVAVTVS